MWVLLTRVGAWFYLKSLINHLTGIFGKDGKIFLLWQWIKGMGVKAWFGIGAVIRMLISDLKILFGKDSAIGRLVNNTIKAFKELKLFGEGSKIRALMTWITGVFGPDGSIGKRLGELKAKWLNFFGPDSKIRQKIKWIASVFGPEGNIGKHIDTMK